MRLSRVDMVPLIIQVTVRYVEPLKEGPYVSVRPIYDWIYSLETGPVQISHVPV
jgi:hypothetical protein